MRSWRIKKILPKPFYWFFYFVIILIYLPFLLAISILIRVRSSELKEHPKLIFGSTPIINNSYWSNALKASGYSSETFTTDFYATINNRDDWGRILDEEYKFIRPAVLRPLIAFMTSIIRYDVFVIPFSGYFIGQFPFLWRTQAFFFRLARKKVVVIPYGADAFIYRRIRSTALIHGLLMSYPVAARNQNHISHQVDYWCKNADCVLNANMGPDGFGRWDVLLHSVLAIDLEKWRPTTRVTKANGEKGNTVFVAHAPNHRGFKGTEFVVDAIERLKSEGFDVELILLEKVKNEVVRDILANKVDILVEQLIYTGYTLNGIEGMAAGLPVIDNLEDDNYLLPVRRWSYFGECPVVSASPETLVDVLRKLVTQPKLRHQLGKAGRAYVEKYHGLDSAQYLFTNVLDYLYGRRDSLINLYHPLLGEYPNRSPKIKHPLVNNRIVD